MNAFTKIDASEPLPGAGEPPSGRWAVPYVAKRTGLWTVHVRYPLTPRQVAAGLLDTISASTPDALETGKARQDELADRLNAVPREG